MDKRDDSMGITRRTFIKLSGAAALGVQVGKAGFSLSSVHNRHAEVKRMRRIQVDFGKKVRDWDGFGVNYVEAAQTRDYKADGTFSVEPGYYFYKQVCRAGQPGMYVCRVLSNDSEVGLIGFANNGTRNPDAFIVINVSDEVKDMDIKVSGSASESFRAYRTSENEKYVSLGGFAVRDGVVKYNALEKSVTTFYG